MLFFFDDDSTGLGRPHTDVAFNLALTTLSDPYGNVAEAISAANRNFTDYNGVLTACPDVLHRLQGGQLDTGVWFNTNPSGDLLHPQIIMDGERVTWAYADWEAATWAEKSYCNYQGKYYKTVNGGTDVTFGSAIIWVEQGLYNRDFGILVEGSIQNKCTNYNANPDVGLTNLTLSGDVAATMTRVADAAELTNKGLSAQCTDGNAVKLDNSAGVADANITVEGISNTNPHSVSIWWRGSGTGRLFIAGVAGTNLTIPATYTRETNTDITPLGTSKMVIRAEAGAIIYFVLNQLEESPIVSSVIVTEGSAVTRGEEMGAIKWATTNLPTSGNLTWATLWCPQFASVDLAAALRVILALNNNTADLLGQASASSLSVRSFDGINNLVTGMPAWKKGDCIMLTVTANKDTNLMSLHYRNMSTKDSVVTHVASVPYDGAFDDTGFLQLLKALGGNNSIFKAILGWDRSMTNAEIDARFNQELHTHLTCDNTNITCDNTNITCDATIL